MSFVTNAPDWALGYLRGRVEAFCRGRLTLAHVRGAARKALELGASDAQIAKVLAPYGLTWSGEHKVLRQP